MARRPQPNVEAELAALDALRGNRMAQIEAVERALAGHCRVAARAARIAEESLLYELIPSLQASYARFLEKPLKLDPSCFAKKALTRALVALDCNDAEFFLRGLEYRQLEPVWGGTADTAADVRASCAMGLVASGYSRALVALTALLHDADAGARLGAVRAIACGNRREAEVLLRSKALAGDVEAQVIGECFTGLLAVEPEESVAFVAGYLGHRDNAVRELAALALGESRLESALGPLKKAWSGLLVSAEFRRALVRAAAAHRSDAAFAWLLELVHDARTPVAAEIIEALAPYRRDGKLLQRLREALVARADGALLEQLSALER